MVKPLDLHHSYLPLPHPPVILNNHTRDNQPKNLDLMGCAGDLGLLQLRTFIIVLTFNVLHLSFSGLFSTLHVPAWIQESGT